MRLAISLFTLAMLAVTPATAIEPMQPPKPNGPVRPVLPPKPMEPPKPVGAAKPKAEPEPVFPPKSWEKIDTGAAPAEALLNVRDGYAIWTERVLVPETAGNRAESFTVTLYRLKLGDKKPEKLGQTVTTYGIDALLGPNGAVAAAYGHRFDTIHIPGKPPIELPKDVNYTAHAFTNDGLLCSAYRYALGQKEAEHSMVLFPIDHDKGKLGEEKFLLLWRGASELNGCTPDFAVSPVLHRGNFLACAGTVPVERPKGKQGAVRVVTEVYDVRTDKLVWRDNGALEAADDKYAYFFLKRNVIARRALDGKGKTEQMMLPEHSIRLDVHPTRVLALVARDQKWGVSSLDLVTGERVDYDLTVRSSSYAIFNFRIEPTHSFGVYIDHKGLPLNFDVKTGEVRALWEKNLYKVPVSQRVPADKKPQWEPLAESK